jgi:hypothetical protein
MRLSIKGAAISGAVVWGAAILLVGLINLASPHYGASFLQLTSSVYPGFHDSHTLLSVGIGTIDGLVDGAVAGILLAWLYNSFSGTFTHTHP